MPRFVVLIGLLSALGLCSVSGAQREESKAVTDEVCTLNVRGMT